MCLFTSTYRLPSYFLNFCYSFYFYFFVKLRGNKPPYTLSGRSRGHGPFTPACSIVLFVVSGPAKLLLTFLEAVYDAFELSLRVINFPEIWNKWRRSFLFVCFLFFGLCFISLLVMLFKVNFEYRNIDSLSYIYALKSGTFQWLSPTGTKNVMCYMIAKI